MSLPDKMYRCPRPDCGSLFTDLEAIPGKLLTCPDCRRPMNARPAAMDQELQARERESKGGAGATIDRLPLAVLADNIRSLWNVGSIFRTSDSCGVELLVLAGITGTPPRQGVAKTALGAEQAVRWRYHAEALAALNTIREEGYTPVALETVDHGTALPTFQWPQRPCLVVGNEVRGVSPEVLDACDLHVSIPMRGVKDSLNVSVAFGIAIHYAAMQIASRNPDSLPQVDEPLRSPLD
jgi:tRNA G18 (ribose-2'-O)-methylase SpoU